METKQKQAPTTYEKLAADLAEASQNCAGSFYEPVEVPGGFLFYSLRGAATFDLCWPEISPGVRIKRGPYPETPAGYSAAAAEWNADQHVRKE